MTRIKLPNIPSELQKLALEIFVNISQHDGKWSWYELDRSLSYGDNLPLLNNMISILEQLEADNFIFTNDSKSASQPKYWITEHGKKFLSSNKTSSLP